MSSALERARALLRGVVRPAPGPAGLDGAAALAEMLYTRWYHDVQTAAREYPDRAAYRGAYVTGAGFEPGWRVVALRADAGPGAILVEQRGRQRLARAAEYVPADPRRLHVTPGDEVLIANGIEEINRGFWHLWSPAWQRAAPTRLTRIYFQVAAGRETAFVAHVSAHAPAPEPWTMKLLSGSHPSGRIDAAVLFVDCRAGVRARWLRRLIADTASLLGDGAPPFTCGLAAGVAWADDPGGGISFGEHRCRLLARAACDAPASLSSASRWRSAAARAFEREGLDIERPHLHRTAGRRRAHAV